MPILLFAIAFVQQFLIAFNIRNISQSRVLFASGTSFIIATAFSLAVVIIASNLNDWLNLISYGLGASCGVAVSIKFDNYLHKTKGIKGENKNVENRD